MNDGVEMILERMKTHPEEFYGEENRWTYIVHSYEKFFTEYEKETLEKAIYDMRRKEFTQRVMEKLLEEEPMPVEIDPNTFTINTTGRTGVWNGGSVTLNRPQKTLTLQDIKESTLETYKQELEELLRNKGIYK